MAIGDGTTNNGSSNSGKIYDNTYFSRQRFRNTNISTALSTKFNGGLLKLEISNIKDGFNYEPVIEISISPTKALMLCDEIKKFKEYIKGKKIEENVAFGINAGMNEKISYIGLHSNENKDIFLTIGKFDGSGAIVESATYTMNKDYHFSLEWKDIAANDLDKVYHDNVELDQFETMIEDFAHYMNGALAYSVWDIGKYDTSRILRKMDPIFDKLGIERLSGNKSNRSFGTNNYLNNASKSSNHTSYDSLIPDDIPDMDD